jgi:hypothetical protein
MSIKITIPNTSSDVLTFGSANTPTAAQIAGIDSGSSNGQLALYTTASGTSTERVRVDASGNVGIGTSSPGQKLEVYNAGGGPTFRVTSADTGTGSGNGFSIGLDNTGAAYLTQNENQPLILLTNATERARLDSSGNLLVGRTSAFAAGQGSSPSLQVSTAGSGGIALTNGSNALFIYRDNTNQITYFYNGSNQASLTAAGAWTNASDAKLKKEITTIKYGLDTVLATQPRSYKRVDVDGDYVGFVAQELKEQVPEVVFGSDTVQYSVDYGSLVAVAFKAIQELKALVDAQASTITQLQADVAALKGASA